MSATGAATERDLARSVLSVLPRFFALAVATARERGTISPERSRVLRQLRSGPRRAGELAHQCLMTRSSLTEVVDGLVEEGLVRRYDEPMDRRAVVLALTPSGRRELERFEAAVAAALGVVLARLDGPARERVRGAVGDLERAFLEVSDVR